VTKLVPTVAPARIKRSELLGEHMVADVSLRPVCPHFGPCGRTSPIVSNAAEARATPSRNAPDPLPWATTLHICSCTHVYRIASVPKVVEDGVRLQIRSRLCCEQTDKGINLVLHAWSDPSRAGGEGSHPRAAWTQLVSADGYRIQLLGCMQYPEYRCREVSAYRRSMRIQALH
jgi:hypothetical protein